MLISALPLWIGALAGPAAAAELAPVAADPAAYGDKVLVLLSAKVERGHAPDGLAKAAALPGARAARLDSSHFKGLMPCYEVVVAGAFDDLVTAKRLAAALQAAGVDHTIKRAGTYVGPQKALDGACAALHSPPKGDARFGFVEEPGVALPLPAGLVERAVDGVAPVAATGDPSVWTRALPARTAGPFTVGEALRVADYQRGLTTCAVGGLSRGVVGQPHWGALEAGLKAPACGDEALYAALPGCAAEGVVLMPWAADVEVGVWAGPEAAGADPGAWAAQVGPWSAEAAEVARSHGLQPELRWASRPLRLGARELVLWTVELVAAPEAGGCGMPGYLRQAAGLVDRRGRPVAPMQVIDQHRVLGVIAPTPGGEPALHLREDLTGTQRLQGAGLDVTRVRPYCDCPC